MRPPDRPTPARLSPSDSRFAGEPVERPGVAPGARRPDTEAPRAASGRVRGARVWTWLRRAATVAAVVGAVVAGQRTAEGYDETRAAALRGVAAAEASLVAIPLLAPGETAHLRRQLNARHVALGEALGVAPVDSLGGVPAGLVRADTLGRVDVLDGLYSDPLLTPDALAALDLVAVRFRAALAAAGAPPFRIVATSLFRSGASQAALRRVNANAAVGRSSHEFGTTFDLSYRRFRPEAAAVAVSARVPSVFRPAVQRIVGAAVAAEHARLAAEYPSRLEALLGRALIGLEDDGAIVVLRETRQTVFHVTVARRLAAESLPRDDEPR